MQDLRGVEYTIAGLCLCVKYSLSPVLVLPGAPEKVTYPSIKYSTGEGEDLVKTSSVPDVSHSVEEAAD